MFLHYAAMCYGSFVFVLCVDVGCRFPGFDAEWSNVVVVVIIIIAVYDNSVAHLETIYAMNLFPITGS